MENLNAETVKKALECCTYGGDITKSQVEVCSPCPYFDEGNCTDVLKENALALIKSQEQKIIELEKRLKECENGYEGTLALKRAKVKELTEENEKIGIENFNLICELSRIKEDTVRKMRAQLYEKFLKVARCQIADELNMRSQEVFAILDQIAKELMRMVGDEKIREQYPFCVKMNGAVIYCESAERYDELIGDISRSGIQEALDELVERIKGYYGALKGQTYAGLVAYHVEKVKEMMVEEYERKGSIQV